MADEKVAVSLAPGDECAPSGSGATASLLSAASSSAAGVVDVEVVPTHPPDIMIIAHRGVPAKAPENTMAGFRLALASHAAGVETDLRVTKDGVVVLFHDESVERTSNGKGKVSDYTLAQIRELDAGSWFSKSFAGEKIPTLDEFFELMASSDRKDFVLVLDLKERNPEIIVKAVIGGIERYGFQDRTIVGSQIIEVLADFAPYTYLQRQWVGRVPLDWTPEYITNHINTHTIHHMSLQLVPKNPKKTAPLSSQFITTASPSMNRTASHKGRIFAWTINTEDRLLECIDIGVSGIHTDDVELVYSALQDIPALRKRVAAEGVLSVIVIHGLSCSAHEKKLKAQAAKAAKKAQQKKKKKKDSKGKKKGGKSGDGDSGGKGKGKGGKDEAKDTKDKSVLSNMVDAVRGAFGKKHEKHDAKL